MPRGRTALAEAEIEYAEDECDSIFVRFKLTEDPNGVLAKHGIPLDKAWIVIWTTTTWTLPANEAICLNGQFEYAFVKIGEEYHIMATELVKSVMDACHIENYEIVGEPVPGAEFELMRYNHVYLPKGAGHSGRPRHAGKRFRLRPYRRRPRRGRLQRLRQKYPQVPITVPVDDGGYLTELAGKYAGLGLGCQQDHSGAHQAVRRLMGRAAHHPPVPALLALPSSHHLPCYRAVVLLH